jgi:hypothetical protein
MVQPVPYTDGAPAPKKKEVGRPKWDWGFRIAVIIGVLIGAFSNGHLSIALVGLAVVLFASAFYVIMRLRQRRVQSTD